MVPASGVGGGGERHWGLATGNQREEGTGGRAPSVGCVGSAAAKFEPSPFPGGLAGRCIGALGNFFAGGLQFLAFSTLSNLFLHLKHVHASVASSWQPQPLYSSGCVLVI